MLSFLHSMLHLFRKGTHLTKVPCSMRLNISVGDTSMKRRKEKQLPSLSAKGCKDKVINTHQCCFLIRSTQAEQCLTSPESFVGVSNRSAILTFSMEKRLLDVVRREGRQQHLKQPGDDEHRTLFVSQSNKNGTEHIFVPSASNMGQQTFDSHISIYFTKGSHC